MNVNQKIKRLIVNECSCYSSFLDGIVYIKNKPQKNTIKDYCDKEREDCRCFIFKNKRCGYFEEVVLPMNPQLEALYIAEHKAKMANYELTKEDKQQIIEGKSSIVGKVKIHCKKCGKTFEADNYRQQYCELCKRYIRRESNRNSKQKERCQQSVL